MVLSVISSLVLLQSALQHSMQSCCSVPRITLDRSSLRKSKPSLIPRPMHKRLGTRLEYKQFTLLISSHRNLLGGNKMSREGGGEVGKRRGKGRKSEQGRGGERKGERGE